MKLRPYQSRSRNSTLQAWDDGARSVLGTMPTGCGKTVVFAHIIEKLGVRAMVVAHREELIWQARDKIQIITGHHADVEMGDHKADESGNLLRAKAQVVVSTVQTLTAGGDGAGRVGKFDPMDFGLLIIDEAHHATSPSYRRVMDYFLTNPALKILGVTATPDRADEEALGQVFEQVAFDYEVLDAIRDGWLVPVEQQMVNVEGLDFSSVRTTAGDLNGSDLAAIMESEKNLHGIASSTIDIIGQRRGIGFSASVNHARVLSEIFNRHHPGMSRWVCGATPKDERASVVKDFAAGNVQWLWNCGVFVEGFDESGVEVISMAAPTKSRSKYAQMIGRATRPLGSIAHRLNEVPDAPQLRRAMIARSAKPSCLVIDFVGNSGKHKLVNTADILGGNVSDEAVEAAREIARRTGKPMRMDKTIEEEEKKIEEAKRRKLEEEARRARLVGKATYKTQSINPFDVLALRPVKSRGWDDNKQLSEKQRGVLRKSGLDPDSFSYAEGKQLVTTLIDRWSGNKCTLKQAALLERCGWSKAEAAAMEFKDASAAIDKAAKNRWRKPTDWVAPLKIEPPSEAPALAAVMAGEEDDIPF